MARFLRQNTATIVTVGPFFDKTDGVTIETALTITNERISLTVDLNEGSAPTLVLDNVTGATSGTANDLNYIANCDAGLMQLELAAANVNYVGRAFLTITDAANHVPVFHEFTILPANVYDSIVLGTDLLDINTAQWLGTACATPTVNGVPEVDATHVGGTAQTGRDIGASVLLSSGTGTGQVSISGGRVDANATYIAGSAVDPAAAQLGVNVVNAGGTAWGSGAITAASIATGAIDADAIAADAIGASELAADAIAEIVAAIKALVVEAEDSRTLGQVLSVIYAACAGVTASGGTVLKDPTGAATRITATVNGSNERTAMTITPSA